MLNLIQQCFTDRIIGESAWFFIVYLCTSVSNTHSKIRKRWGFDFVGDFCFFLRFFLNYQQSLFCYSIKKLKTKNNKCNFIFVSSSFRNSSSNVAQSSFCSWKQKINRLWLYFIISKKYTILFISCERGIVNVLIIIFKQNCKSIPKLYGFTVACTVIPSNKSHWYAF